MRPSKINSNIERIPILPKDPHLTPKESSRLSEKVKERGNLMLRAYRLRPKKSKPEKAKAKESGWPRPGGGGRKCWKGKALSTMCGKKNTFQPEGRNTGSGMRQGGKCWLRLQSYLTLQKGKEREKIDADQKDPICKFFDSSQ